MDKKQERIISDLQEKYNCSREEILEIINSPFQFIRKTVKDLDFTSIETEEELEKLKTNFNIPKIGKLYANFYNIKRINNVRKHKRRKS